MELLEQGYVDFLTYTSNRTRNVFQFETKHGMQGRRIPYEEIRVYSEIPLLIFVPLPSLPGKPQSSSALFVCVSLV
jgi:hypothetical protein